jgi:glutaredoxin
MITVYSKKNCPACDQAKRVLTQRQMQYNEVRIDEDIDAREFLLAAGHRTVPQIYDGGMHVEGGIQGLQQFLTEAA